MQQRLDKLTPTQGHVVTSIVGFLVGLIFWLLYKWVPDSLPFAIGWAIVRPLFRIHQYIDREMNL